MEASPTPEHCPAKNYLGEIRPIAFTLCYKVSAPSVLPPCFELVDLRERDGDD